MVGISLLLMLSLLHTTSSSVYYVIPDDHYTTNNNTYTLQHYLNNTNKYFTSHTQLHFLPGQYYLNTDLFIQHVSNLSLIGNRTNEVINSVIKCTSPAGIVVVGSSNIVIANIVTNECGNKYNHIFKNSYMTSLFVCNCTVITIYYFHSLTINRQSGIMFLNTLQNIKLFNLVAPNLTILYYKVSHLYAESANIIYIDRLNMYTPWNYFAILKLEMQNSSVIINTTLINSSFTSGPVLQVMCKECSGFSIISVIQCNFSDSRNTKVMELWQYYTPSVFINYENCMSNRHPNNIKFTNCRFSKYNLTTTHYFKNSLMLFLFEKYKKTNTSMHTFVSITDCIFTHIVAINCITMHYEQYNQVLVSFKNITISHLYVLRNALSFYHINLTIEGLTVTDIMSHFFIDITDGYLEFHKYVEIASSVMMVSFHTPEIYLKENVVMNFTSNQLLYVIFSRLQKYPILSCPIQYISSKHNLDKRFLAHEQLNYSVILDRNYMLGLSNTNTKWCKWSSRAAFSQVTPLQVNERFVHFMNTTLSKREKIVCLCNSNITYNCSQEEILEDAFPGEHISINLFLRHSKFTAVIVENIDEKYSENSLVCDTGKEKIKLEIAPYECKRATYLIKQKSKNWCALSLLVTALPKGNNWLAMYTVLLRPCPKGFSLHPQGYCQCDPILSSHIPSLTTCDIDLQTIPRPANTWISAHTINNSHSYHVSLHCPFDYCLPHLSQLNLSTLDSQCQFNRSGVLCGQCQHGLSNVFGSSYCKHCLNFYLLIILPIGIAGILLVILMFLLNLTTTEGKLNSLLFYTNVVGINNSMLFPTRGTMYTFTALANLDLGIETCFYNGMDDYAKMWLQLVFPIYLIFIATLLIITSRYSSTIQRLTARRALPVLATLFLLSYTKVLLTVSNVLFSYTSIIHLPSNHTTLVWSVDTSVPLFGVKFTILFIACLILFLILVPFNIALLFTRTLSYFNIINYCKPLLDAYQGPYKIKFYYWPGLQLLMRAILFSISALDRNINLLVSVIMLEGMIWVHVIYLPFKNIQHNIMEFFSLLNLHTVFMVILVTTSEVVIVNISVALTVFQLTWIILSHLNSVLMNKSAYSIKITQLLTALKSSLQSWTKLGNVHQRQPIELVNAVPEVAHNYREFQEPLIGISK